MLWLSSHYFRTYYCQSDGVLWLSLLGAVLSYFLWFRGIERLEPKAVASPGFLSPLTAVLLGWVVLGESMTVIQFLGALIVLIYVWIGNSPVNFASNSNKAE